MGDSFWAQERCCLKARSALLCQSPRFCANQLGGGDQRTNEGRWPGKKTLHPHFWLARKGSREFKEDPLAAVGAHSSFSRSVTPTLPLLRTLPALQHFGKPVRDSSCVSLLAHTKAGPHPDSNAVGRWRQRAGRGLLARGCQSDDPLLGQPLTLQCTAGKEAP